MNYSEAENRPRGIILTDFDGTLFNRERYITDENYSALKEAREAGYITAIDTGRSLYSFKRVAKQLSRPIGDYFDYLIFSSGAGIIKFSDDSLFEADNLSPPEANEAAALLFKQGIDFMIQREVPDNHFFVYVKSNGAINPDFYRRINIYQDFARPLDPADGDSELERIEQVCFEGVSQLVAVIPPSGGDDDKYAAELMEYLRHRLADYTIIRTTSPIDHRSLWIEVFNCDVSKSKTAARLTEKFGLDASSALAIGNDFNDEDMLRWAGTSRTVDEAPPQLKNCFCSAGRAVDSAVAAAIREFTAD